MEERSEHRMIENGELTLRKANSFVQEYRVSLSLAETRIVNYLIANIESPKYDKEFRKFRFNIKDFCDIVYPDTKKGDAYKWLPKVIKDLSDKSAYKEVPSEENPGKTKKVLLRWIEHPEFEEGYVTLELNPYLAPYLLQLDKGYFQSQFKYTALAQSKYTIPLYELLKSWERVANHKKVFEIDELRIYMDALKPSQNNVAEFKRTALDPAVKEINEITDLCVEYKEIRVGRKVEKIEFTIGLKNKADKVIYLPEENEKIDAEEEFAKTHYSILMQEFPEFTGKQISTLFSAALKHIDFSNIAADEREYQIAAYIAPKLEKIKATPDETKSTVFRRLLNAVENNY